MRQHYRASVGGETALPTKGLTPNLFWNSISQDDLRQHSSYTNLPPVHDVHLVSDASYRMVRQDSELWTNLHRGNLTTGKLNSCLGFHEAKAAKRLKMGRGFVKHESLLSTWRHLQDLPHKPRGFTPVAAYSSGYTLPSVSRTWQSQKSRALASAGPQRLRMAWGNAQEASALYSVMHVFPKSQLLECGLFQLDLDTIPKEWGFKPGDLPPLGASPDGMFLHPSVPDMEQNLSGAEESPVADNTAYSWLNFPPGLAQDQVATAQNSTVSKTAEESQIRQLLAGLHVSGSDKTSHPLSLSGWMQAQELSIPEIVEVKNRSPFHRVRDTAVWTLSDTNAESQLLPMWVPQLQLEMLASQASSALLVRRYATQGLVIFRVQRDDSFLRQMLVFVRKFYLEYVKTSRAPPRDMFFERQDYQALINTTIRIARTAKLLARVPAPAVPPNSDSRPFLR